MSRTIRSILLTAGLALILAACGPAAPAGPTPVRLLLTYRPDVQFAPYYVGIEKGYYAAHNLDVTLAHLDESDVTKHVATGEDPFGVVSGEQVLLARAQGLPVVYTFAWFNNNPTAIVSKAEKNIVKPEDLAGKSVGVPLQEGASYIALEALLQSAGMTDADIDLRVTGYAQVQTLISDQVDAVVVYANNEPIQLAAQGVAINTITIGDYAPLASNGLITNEELIKKDPELVRAMMAAFSESLQYTIDHPDDAFEVSKKYVEGLNDPAVAPTQRQVLDATIKLWRADRLGQTDQATWARMQDVLVRMGLLTKPVDLSAAFTNQFLP